jgi:hypothetical protein
VLRAIDGELQRKSDDAVNSGRVVVLRAIDGELQRKSDDAVNSGQVVVLRAIDGELQRKSDDAVNSGRQSCVRKEIGAAVSATHVMRQRPWTFPLECVVRKVGDFLGREELQGVKQVRPNRGAPIGSTCILHM